MRIFQYYLSVVEINHKNLVGMNFQTFLLTNKMLF